MIVKVYLNLNNWSAQMKNARNISFIKFSLEYIHSYKPYAIHIIFFGQYVYRPAMQNTIIKYYITLQLCHSTLNVVKTT